MAHGLDVERVASLCNAKKTSETPPRPKRILPDPIGRPGVVGDAPTHEHDVWRAHAMRYDKSQLLTQPEGNEGKRHALRIGHSHSVEMREKERDTSN